MAYKTNEQGEVAVRGAKGELKYINKKLAEDKVLMKTMHFEIVEAPEAFVIEEKSTELPQTEVAETLTAKPKSTKNK